MSKTKYNENTGEPYEYEYDIQCTKFENLEIEKSITGILDEIIQNNKHIGVYSFYHLNDKPLTEKSFNKVVIGIPIVSNNSWDDDSNIVVVPVITPNILANAREILEKKFGYKVQVEVYNVMTCSY